MCLVLQLEGSLAEREAVRVIDKGRGKETINAVTCRRASSARDPFRA